MACSQSHKMVCLNLTKRYLKALDLHKCVRNTAALIWDKRSCTEGQNRSRYKEASEIKLPKLLLADQVLLYSR